MLQGICWQMLYSHILMICEKKEAKEAYKNDKEAVFDRDLSMAFQLAEDTLVARLSTIADVS